MSDTAPTADRLAETLDALQAALAQLRQLLPDKPPPDKKGGCCSKIAAFLSIGPRIGVSATVGGTRVELALFLGRADKPRT